MNWASLIALTLKQNNMSRYVIQKSSTRPNGWVLTDKVNSVVVTFDDGAYNETQKVTLLEDARLSVDELADIMEELGEWVAKHHGSKCFGQPYGFEYSENDTTLYLYRRKSPRWRMELKDKMDAGQLASTLRKAAEFLTKR